MLAAYIECIKISYKSNIVFRAEYITTIINSILSILVGVSIWKAIYNGVETVEKINIHDVTSYIVIAFALQTVFVMDEYILDKKIRTGAIATDLVRPIEIRTMIFFQNIGMLLFKIATQLLPILLVAAIFFDFRLPPTFMLLSSFVVSCCLGYLVLYNLNLIFWTISFWVHVTWSVITIKDALLMLFSGVLFPIWFMPQPIHDIMQYTPFESIYYLPISIYIGKIETIKIVESLLLQVMWVVLLYLFGCFLWNKGLQKISIQGG